MARSLRIEFKGPFYHVTDRGNGRGKIYYANADYEKFKDYLKEVKKNMVSHRSWDNTGLREQLQDIGVTLFKCHR